MKGIYKNETGQAMVEFALVLPLLLLILFFIIDFCWIGYQKASFEEGVSYASWDISANDLGDTDPIESIPSERVYTGATVTAPLLAGIQDSSLWGFYPLHVTVTNATAKLYNSETTFNVPGRVPTDTTAAISRTRHMDLEADLVYEIQPLTFVGQLFFGNTVEVEKHLECTRIVGSQHRSE